MTWATCAPTHTNSNKSFSTWRSMRETRCQSGGRIGVFERPASPIPETIVASLPMICISVDRRRRGHDAASPRSHLRALFHHEARRPRHRARFAVGASNRRPPRWTNRGRIRQSERARPSDSMPSSRERTGATTGGSRRRTESSNRDRRQCLVVDDDDDVRDAVALALESGGYTVLRAADGTEALEMIRQTRQTSSTLVITDLNMPVTRWPRVDR